MSDGMVMALRAALAELRGSRSVTGVMITGVPGAFCAGADLHGVMEKSASSSGISGEQIEREGQSIIKDLVALEVPTVAAVDGPAVGMGFDIALACDVMLLGKTGWCMQGWGRLGLVAGTAGSLFLTARNPQLLWTLLAEQPRIDARLAEAWRIGQSAGDRSAKEVGLELLQRLSHLPRPALAEYVRVQRHDVRAVLDEHLAVVGKVQADLITSPEFRDLAAKLVGGQHPDRGSDS